MKVDGEKLAKVLQELARMIDGQYDSEVEVTIGVSGSKVIRLRVCNTDYVEPAQDKYRCVDG